MDSAMSENFDWNETSIVIHEQPETAVYLNPSGQIVVRQRQWPDDDSFVYVSPEFAGILVRAIMDAADYAPDEAPAPRLGEQAPHRVRQHVATSDAEPDASAGRREVKEAPTLFSTPKQAAE
jgi:hypothetical protein